MLFNACPSIHLPDGDRSSPRPVTDEWSQRLTLLNKHKGAARIVTYSMPDLDFISEHCGRRTGELWVICHSSFKRRAIALKSAFRHIHVAVKDHIYAKVLLVAPETVYVTNAHFGGGGRHGVAVDMRAAAAYDAFVAESFNGLWAASTEISA